MLKWAGNLKRKFKHLKRFQHIAAVLMRHGFEELGNLTSRNKDVKNSEQYTENEKIKKTLSRAQRVRLVLEELGPTFIKFGQLLSTRPDLLPAEYISELEKLQDQVPPEKYDIIREQIKNELGDYPENIFAKFEQEPIAAGSIGQVHYAQTKDGQEIVLKVRRPNIVERVKTETEILLDLAVKYQHYFAKEDDTINPKRLVNEFTIAVNKEVDFTNERRNQQRFIRNFKNDNTIHIPEIIEEYSTDSIIAMEYIKGKRPGDAQTLSKAGLNPKEVAKVGADFVLRQVFTYGFFHTDPHPGNFFVLEDNILAPIDFGQVGRIGSQERRLLREIVVSIVTGDATQMIRGLQHAELIDDKTDVNDLTRETEILFDSYYGLPLKDIPFGEIIMQGFEIMRKYYVSPPSDFTLMMKSLTTVESFAANLDKDFRLFEYLKPYAKKFSVEDYLPSNVAKNTRKMVVEMRNLASKLPEDIHSILNKIRKGNVQVKVHHEHLETLSNTLDKSSNRISFAVIIAALLIGSSMLVPQDGTVLGLVSLQTLGVSGYIGAAILGIWLLISIIRSKSW
ncbi:MAG: ABC1 kinase family protein [Sedimentisphaeraceae bacterium JB056]